VNAYPSVTNVLSILHKEFLVAYKVNQAILAALTLPKIEGESEDDFARRVVTDSKEHAASAARLGSRMHEIAAAVLLGSKEGLALEGEIVEGRRIAGLQQTIIELIEASRPSGYITDQEFSEFYISNPLGYAGTCDGLTWLDSSNPVIAQKLTDAGFVANGDPVIAMADIKTRGSDAKTAPIYETDLLQLAAYLHAIPTTPTLGFQMDTSNTPVANILINTHDKAGQDGIWTADIIIHPRESIEQAWEAFKHAHALWCWVKGYHPQSQSK
jgi:hypothetical protein